MQEYIVRTNYAGIPAGCLVVSGDITQDEVWVEVVEGPAHTKSLKVWMPVNNVLKLSKYLKRKPRSEYLALSFKSKFKSGLPHYIKDTKDLTRMSMHKPFRFESLGEVIFFINNSNLDLRHVTIHYINNRISNYEYFRRNNKRKTKKNPRRH
jgi:hypothetical protein